MQENPLIEITLRYTNLGGEEFQEAFLYLNDTEVKQSVLDKIVDNFNDKDVIPAKFGLPQLSPCSFVEEEIENNHPFHEIKSIKFTEYDEEKHHIVETNDLELFSSIITPLIEGKEIARYTQMHKEFLRSQILDNLHSVKAYFDVMGKNVDDVENLIGKIQDLANQ